MIVYGWFVGRVACGWFARCSGERGGGRGNGPGEEAGREARRTLAGGRFPILPVTDNTRARVLLDGFPFGRVYADGATGIPIIPVADMQHGIPISWDSQIPGSRDSQICCGVYSASRPAKYTLLHASYTPLTRFKRVTQNWFASPPHVKNQYLEANT